jgi:hypothetical protein
MPSANAPLGLIAGSGRFPILVAREAKKLGLEIVALGIKGVTDPSLEPLVSRLHYFKLGQIAEPIKTFKTAGVQKVVMAGKVQHVSLFGGVFPDLRAAKLLLSLKDKKTDTILKAVADEFEKDGLELISSTTYLSHLMAQNGPLTKRRMTGAEKKDAALGWKAAKALSGLDIGQSVVVKGGAVIAVEAMEGTDACILRASELAGSQGEKTSLVLVKVAKPRQDMRFDVPILGLDSLDVFRKASVTALALEAGATMIFDKEEFLSRAEKQNIAIEAFPAEGPVQ